MVRRAPVYLTGIPFTYCHLSDLWAISYSTYSAPAADGRRRPRSAGRLLVMVIFRTVRLARLTRRSRHSALPLSHHLADDDAALFRGGKPCLSQQLRVGQLFNLVIFPLLVFVEGSDRHYRLFSLSLHLLLSPSPFLSPCFSIFYSIRHEVSHTWLCRLLQLLVM